MKKFPPKEHYLKDFFDHAPIGFHSFGRNKIIIDMNQTELNMLGYAREEIIGKKTWQDLIVPGEIPLFKKHWQMINLKGEVRNLTYTLLRKDGRQLKVLLNATARFDSFGKLIHTRGSVIELAGLGTTGSDKRKLQKNIQENIEQTILPLIEKLKRRGSPLDKRYLILLQEYLQDLTSEFALKLMAGKWRLSAREVEICKMLKKGLKTKDIADLLCTSMRTIEHHRNHIRKKLMIADPAIDLINYLKNFSL